HPPASLKLQWAGAALEVPVPAGCALPAFLMLRGVPQPPPGELVLVLQKRSGWLDLLRRSAVYQAEVEAQRLSE
ncbi:MAG TPA: hypothetical protein VGQ73_00775, partial [Gemmatimonadales bacterium]|nr:hypothetical protein [Gemmatimonadales bacterium]